jgi:superfamily II DNA or RNA helicase
MIHFKTGPVYTSYRFSDLTAKQMFAASRVIQEVTSARPEGFQYMPRFKSKRWDGYIRLAKGNKFPTGLLSFILAALVDEGFQMDVTLYDAPDLYWDALQDDMFFPKILRDYQVDAVKRLTAYHRGVAKMATNSGKTLVIAALAKMMPGNVLILVTKKDLLYQMERVLDESLDEVIGLIGDGNQYIERVTIGMIQTLIRRVGKDRTIRALFKDLDCVMFDECHHVPSKTAQIVMNAIEAPYRFGFSGTPLSHNTLNDLVLMGATGPVLIEVTNEDLIEQGISARPTVFMFDPDADEIDDKVSYPQAYEDGIVQCPARNYKIREEVVNRKANSTLILVDRIAHGRLLEDTIPGAIFVSGSDGMDVRTQALQMLRQKNNDIVIATPIFDEGIDVPAVDLLVLAGGGKGHRKLLQRIGRGLRAKVGANTLTVIDFTDTHNDYLFEHSEIRMMLYEDEGFEIEEID